MTQRLYGGDVKVVIDGKEITMPSSPTVSFTPPIICEDCEEPIAEGERYYYDEDGIRWHTRCPRAK